MPHFTNSLYSLRMPESQQQNRPTKQNSTHRYNSFIAHARFHELKNGNSFFLGNVLCNHLSSSDNIKAPTNCVVLLQAIPFSSPEPPQKKKTVLELKGSSSFVFKSVTKFRLPCPWVF